jgi:opacity protein-like surface antigen
MRREMDFGKKTLLAAALIAAPLTAAHAASNVDLYYVGISELETEGAPAGDFKFDEGDGYGAKVRFHLNDMLFLSGEYQNVEFDEVEYDRGTPNIPLDDLGLEREIETWRAGLGFQFVDTPFYVLGEYIGLESELSTNGSEDDEETLGDDFDENGFGAHLGAKGNVTEMLTLNAQIGYVDVGDTNGLEYLVGAGLNFTPNLGIFADYRYTSLDGDDSSIDLNLTDARVGVRLTF